jgi:dTDP-glucose 4,6-dehydratase
MRAGDGRVIPTFVNQALRSEPLTVFGDGSQTRSYCFVSDLVDGIYRMAMSQQTGPVNLGNPVEEYSVLDVARLIVSLVGSRSTIAHKGLPQDDPKVRRPDITRARKLLGWEPKISLEHGVRMTIDYFRSLPQQVR